MLSSATDLRADVLSSRGDGGAARDFMVGAGHFDGFEKKKSKK